MYPNIIEAMQLFVLCLFLSVVISVRAVPGFVYFPGPVVGPHLTSKTSDSISFSSKPNLKIGHQRKNSRNAKYFKFPEKPHSNDLREDKNDRFFSSYSSIYDSPDDQLNRKSRIESFREHKSRSPKSLFSENKGVENPLMKNSGLVLNSGSVHNTILLTNIPHSESENHVSTLHENENRVISSEEHNANVLNRLKQPEYTKNAPFYHVETPGVGVVNDIVGDTRISSNIENYIDNDFDTYPLDAEHQEDIKTGDNSEINKDLNHVDLSNDEFDLEDRSISDDLEIHDNLISLLNYENFIIRNESIDLGYIISDNEKSSDTNNPASHGLNPSFFKTVLTFRLVPEIRKVLVEGSAAIVHEPTTTIDPVESPDSLRFNGKEQNTSITDIEIIPKDDYISPTRSISNNLYQNSPSYFSLDSDLEPFDQYGDEGLDKEDREIVSTQVYFSPNLPLVDISDSETFAESVRSRQQSSLLAEIEVEHNVSTAVNNSQLPSSLRDDQGSDAPLIGVIHSCPRLLDDVTIECRTRRNITNTVKRFWWVRRHFDSGDHLIKDQLLAIDGQTLTNDSRIHVEQISPGHQLLQLSQVNSSDTGMYMCQVSWGQQTAEAEMLVVLCH